VKDLLLSQNLEVGLTFYCLLEKNHDPVVIMGGRTTSFTKFTITSTFTTIFGITSVLVGIAQSCAWLGVMGVITFLGTPKPYTVDRTYGPVSGHALGLMAASGLWCGIWVS